jgi:hypothetical protein
LWRAVFGWSCWGGKYCNRLCCNGGCWWYRRSHSRCDRWYIGGDSRSAVAVEPW